MRWTRVLIPFITVALMAPALASASPTPPEQLARQTVQKVLNDLDGRRAELRNNPQELHALINRDLVPLIDLPYMSQLVLGRYWRQASPEQRKRFQTAFKNMLIRTYGSALLGFNDNVKIEYKPVRAADNAKNVTFNAVIHSPNGQDTPVSLQLHEVDDQWKVYDGSVGNLSFVTNYRGQFNSAIRREGLEKFIEQLENRYDGNS
ncbi:MlaC/ttg2D family ABC transporter substrate-binding protein [Salinisphaera hydrothermalis]|uniref:Toluene tolerance family protein n=1 Tax=Salinisphaera hydrothermalis (strain C41B8) TaxID=1304275 RepID=A0A084IL36_SALHC|nr:ABC transporter substrate-binding protein [Salinisphaera hydrothermalis]KEZ77420.1 toluene tolerance family protein [Salinisphaera hydrothermalis C41B8]